MTAKKKDVPKPPKKTNTKSPAEQTPKTRVGQVVTAVVGEVKYKGLCTHERQLPSGDQVYLKLNGLVSRFFNVSDIKE